MRHRTTEAVWNYYKALRGTRTALLRCEIDPSALKTSLPDLFILEKRRDGNVTFRLAGTRVCTILGQEMRTRLLSEIWVATAWTRIRLAVDVVLANRTPLEIAAAAISDDDEILELEMLMLPVCSTVETCDRVFGSLVTLNRSITIDARRRLLMPSKLVFAQGEPDVAAGEYRPPDAGAAGGGSRPRALTGRAGHLRLLEGGRS